MKKPKNWKFFDFQKSIFRFLKNIFQIFDSLKKNIESQNLKCLKTLKTYVLERFSSWKIFSKMDILWWKKRKTANFSIFKNRYIIFQIFDFLYTY